MGLLAARRSTCTTGRRWWTLLPSNGNENDGIGNDGKHWRGSSSKKPNKKCSGAWVYRMAKAVQLEVGSIDRLRAWGCSRGCGLRRRRSTWTLIVRVAKWFLFMKLCVHEKDMTKAVQPWAVGSEKEEKKKERAGKERKKNFWIAKWFLFMKISRLLQTMSHWLEFFFFMKGKGPKYTANWGWQQW